MIITNDDVSHPKPDPEMLYKIAGAFDATNKKILMIGDTTTDRKMAETAGVQFIQFQSPGDIGNSSLNDESVNDWKVLKSQVRSRLLLL